MEEDSLAEAFSALCDAPHWGLALPPRGEILVTSLLLPLLVCYVPMFKAQTRSTVELRAPWEGPFL